MNIFRFCTRSMAGLVLTGFLMGICSVKAGQPNHLTEKEKAAGWKLLFDGRSLDGWKRYASSQSIGEGWVVEDGLLMKKRGVPGGNIVTQDTFLDFELSWEWRVEPGGNNGIKYLVTEERTGAPGHEYQLLDDAEHPDGSRGAKRQTASFYDVLPPDPNKPLKEPGQWNHSRIVVKGLQVEHWLNGEKVLEYRLESPELMAAIEDSKFKNSAGFGDKIRGHIMLTDHHDECAFRNIKIRELGQ